MVELEKALVNYRMRLGIESSCNAKCENPEVVATGFNRDDIDLNFKNPFQKEETEHFITLLEKSTCYRDCIAGKKLFLNILSRNRVEQVIN